MRLPSLLGHTAQLVRLIWQSPRPADVLASDYFRAKKYIGAHDRRFISQVAFSTLRGYSAFAYCANEALHDIAHAVKHAEIERERERKQHHTTDPKDKEKDLPLEELAIVATCCIMGNAAGVGNISEALEELLGADSTDIEERVLVIGTNFAKHAGLAAETGVLFARSVTEYWTMLEDEVNTLLEHESPDEAAEQLLAVRFCVPQWMFRALDRDWFTTIEIAASLLAPAPLCLRVNTLATTREALLAAFREQALPAHAGKLSPDCIVIDKRVNLTQTPLYRDGLIEIQDEASQLTAFALSPETSWRVLDACAGAGGKSLHIATLQRGKGEILASDTEYERLKELPFRAKRAGISSIKTLMIDAASENALPSKLHHLQGSFDAVLVDAPCSGLGTVRRSPMLKWRATPDSIVKHAQKQLLLLSAFSHAVKPDGVLLYATCSLMPQENEHVVAQFLAEHPEFYAEPLAPVLSAQGIALPGLSADAPMVTMLPSTHGTDGFFLARLRRR